jgi:dihydrodipicolinate synthase/N-acetylneuraminate lyase
VNRFNGIIPPLITPLLDRDTLDEAGLERLVEHVVSGGVSGLFILGTTGEAPSLGYRLRAELIEQTCRLVAGRVPVLVGITDTAFVESINLAHCAADCGATAVVLALPYYFPTSQPELVEYVEHMLPELPLPLMLYNMPTLTKVWFEIETLKRLAVDEKIIGVKDSSGDMDYYARLCALKGERPDWSFLCGPEDRLIESIALGGHGGVNGGANVIPKLFTAAYQSAIDGDTARCAELQQKIEAFDVIYEIGKHASRHIKATKCAASILGLCDDFMAEPFHRFNEPERAKVAAILRKLGVIA